MNLEKEYEKRFGEFPLQHITYYLIAGQVLAFVLGTLNPSFNTLFQLQRNLIFSGEWWRSFTFLFVPLSMSPLWAVLQWYFMYMIGNALEREWGAFQLTLYLGIGYVAALLSALLFPTLVVTNSYLFTSLFLAYAYQYPEFTILVFFILPIKIKWLSYITWFGIGVSFLTGGFGVKTLILLSVSNFLLFFGKELYFTLQDRLKHGKFKLEQRSESGTTYMRCVVCRKTELDRKIFYYCHSCIPELCYCEDHIKSHSHRVVN